MLKKGMSRRKLLRLMGLGAAGSVLAACQPKVVEKVVTQEVEKVVEEEVTRVVEKEVEKVVTNTPAPKEPVKIVHTTWGGPMELEVMENTADLFHEEFPGIDVEILQFPSDYGPKVDAMIVSGSGLDTLQSAAPEYAPRGVLLNLQPYVDVDADLAHDDILPGSLREWTHAGLIFGMPYGSGPQTLYWNKSYFQEMGLEDPNDLAKEGEWDWDKYREYANALTREDEDGNQIFGCFLYSSAWEPYFGMYSRGGKPFNDGFAESYLDTPECIDNLQYYADMMWEDKCCADPMTLSEIGTWQSFVNGRTAMFLSGPWQRGRLVDMEWEYDAGPIPQGVEPTEFTHGAGGGVWTGTKYPEECYEWTSWRTKDSAAALWALQGVDTPPRSSQMHSDIWHDPDINPPTLEPFIKAADEGMTHPERFIPAKAMAVINAGLERIFEGNEPAAEVLEDINPELTETLQETQKWEPA